MREVDQKEPATARFRERDSEHTRFDGTLDQKRRISGDYRRTDNLNQVSLDAELIDGNLQNHGIWRRTSQDQTAASALQLHVGNVILRPRKHPKDKNIPIKMRSSHAASIVALVDGATYQRSLLSIHKPKALALGNQLLVRLTLS